MLLLSAGLLQVIMLPFPSWMLRWRPQGWLLGTPNPDSHMPHVCQKTSGALLEMGDLILLSPGLLVEEGRRGAWSAGYIQWIQYLGSSSYKRISMHSEKDSIWLWSLPFPPFLPFLSLFPLHLSFSSASPGKQWSPTWISILALPFVGCVTTN